MTNICAAEIQGRDAPREAQAFVEFLTGDIETPVHIRLIHDTERDRAEKLSGALPDLWPKIEAAQQEGFGVFVVVNEGGDTDAEITRPRAIFIDLDGEPLPDDWWWHAQPDAIFSRDDRHHHVYWRVAGLPIEQFKPVQKAIAARYDGDPTVSNLSRVMRLPGTLHLKDPANPSMYRRDAQAVTWSGGVRAAPAELTNGLPPVCTTQPNERRKAAATDDLDRPHNLRRARDYLKVRRPAIEGKRNDHTFRTGAALRDMGVSAEAGSILLSEWNEKNSPPLDDTELQRTVENVWRYAQNEPGAAALSKDPRERFSDFAHPGAGQSREKPDFALCTGSDVELARFLRTRLERRDGEILSTEGGLHRYTGSHWEPFDDAALRRDVHPLDGMTYGERGRVKLSQARVSSILNELSAMVAKGDYFRSGEVGVNCANGFVCFDPEGRPSLQPHQREHRVRHVLAAAWNPAIDWHSAPLLSGLLEGCFRDDADQAHRIELIGEIFGAAVLGHATRLSQPRAFVLHGASANNGKSQILDCARGLLPPAAVVSISPGRFGNEPMLAGLAGALLNTAGELGSAQAIASDVFKSVVTGDAVTARRLYQNPIEFRPRALHLFATNTLPSFQGGFDHGVRRRLMVVSFNRTFAPDEMIPNLAGGIVREEIGALLAFAVEGAVRLIRQGHFTEPPSCREALNDWVLSADPVIAWKGARTTFDSGLRAGVRDLYSDFANWAVREGFSGKALPAVNTFSYRLLAHDGRLRRHKANADRSIVGLRLLPAS